MWVLVSVTQWDGYFEVLFREMRKETNGEDLNKKRL